MSDLAMRTALSQIERALVDAIAFAYKVRRPVAANIAAMASVPSKPLADQDLQFVTSEGVTFKFVKLSTATPDGVNTVIPNDVPATAGGRWLRTTSTVQSGYLRAVQLYDGGENDEEILNRIIAQRPAVLVKWVASESRDLSVERGALYGYRADFEAWCISYNLRPQAQAILGSDVAVEALADPGANQIVGDVRATVAGSDLGQAGVSYCSPTKERKLVDDLGQRTFVYSLGISVFATIHQPDTDLITPTTPGAFQVQQQLTAAGGSSVPFGPVDQVPP